MVTGEERYPGRVQRLVLQRWSIVVLIIARLVLGEFAHAMPHHEKSEHSGLPAVAQTQEVPCPDHEDAPDATQRSTDTGEHEGGVQSDDSHTLHCCNSTCDCPCLHLSALASPAVTFRAAPVHESFVSSPTIGQAPGRIDRLFRPPA